MKFTAQNARQTLRSVLEDLSSEHFAAELLKGSINSCVDVIDTHRTFIDFHDKICSPAIRRFANVDDSAWLPLRRLRKSLDALVDLSKYKTDREIIESAVWPLVQKYAKDALDALGKIFPS